MSERKNVIVFGGSGGIGREICRQLITSNNNIIFTYHNGMQTALTIENELTDNPTGAIIKKIQCDATDADCVKKTVHEVISEFKNIDVLINCVGISKEALFVNKDLASWEAVIKANLTSVFLTCHFIVPHMIENMEGNIINISSILGIHGIPGMADYCAAKSAVIGFSRALAAELARFEIRVNCVSPGMIEGEMTQNSMAQIGGSVKKLIPMKRFGTAYDVCGIVDFLVNGNSQYITGENFVVAGGLGKSLPVS